MSYWLEYVIMVKLGSREASQLYCALGLMAQPKIQLHMQPVSR